MDPTLPNPAQSTLPALAQTAAETEDPGSITAVGPDAQKGNGLVLLPFTPEFISQMWDLVEQGTKIIESQSQMWDSLLKSYLPNVKGPGVAEEVNTNSHFRNVHTKLAHLFLQTPEIRVLEQAVGPGDTKRPDPMNPQIMIEMNDILMIKQEVLNKKLGRDGVKVDRLFDMLLFDTLAWAGIGCSKLGHLAIIQTVQKPVMGPDPNFQPPVSTNPLMPAAPVQPPMVPQIDPATGQPRMESVPVPIYQEDYWRRFSPKKYVPDPSCKSTMLDDDASFQGMWFSLYPYQAQTMFELTETDLQKGAKDDKVFEHKDFAENAPDVVMGVELFIKASSIDPAILFPGQPAKAVHPKKLLQMVLLKGNKEKPVVWRECVDQTFTPEGELTDDSLDRFPIRVMTIRDLADSSLPPADSAFTNPLVKTRNTNRRQSIALRDAAIPKMLFDSGAFEDGEIEAVKAGKPGEPIFLKEGSLAQGVDKVMGATITPKMSPDFYQLDNQLKVDMDDTLGIDSNAAGNTNSTVRAATEIAVVQQAGANRSEKERARVIDHLLDGVRLLDILVCRYTSQQEWVKLVGPQGAARYFAWTGQFLSGRWTYDIAPDSQFRVDTAQDRQQHLAFYNLVAKDPLVNRIPVLQRLARMFGYDPAKVIADPALMMTQPQHGGPGDPSQGGAPAAPGAQPPHGGPVNQHEGAKSGGTQNGPGASNLRQDQQEQQHGPAV